MAQFSEKLFPSLKEIISAPCSPDIQCSQTTGTLQRKYSLSPMGQLLSSAIVKAKPISTVIKEGNSMTSQSMKPGNGLKRWLENYKVRIVVPRTEFELGHYSPEILAELVTPGSRGYSLSVVIMSGNEPRIMHLFKLWSMTIRLSFKMILITFIDLILSRMRH